MLNLKRENIVNVNALRVNGAESKDQLDRVAPYYVKEFCNFTLNNGKFCLKVGSKGNKSRPLSLSKF